MDMNGSRNGWTANRLPKAYGYARLESGRRNCIVTEVCRIDFPEIELNLNRLSDIGFRILSDGCVTRLVDSVRSDENLERSRTGC